MKYKVRINNDHWEDIPVQADEFEINNGNLVFYKVTEKEEWVNEPDPFHKLMGTNPVNKVYPYQRKYTDRQKVALFSAGQWVYVSDNASDPS